MTEITIVKCRICGRAELAEDFDGKVDNMEICMDPKYDEDMELARKFGIGRDVLDDRMAVLSSGYCNDCLKEERRIAVKRGEIWCTEQGHGRHRFWSGQFNRCLWKGKLLFDDEEEIHEIQKEWKVSRNGRAKVGSVREE